MTPPMQPALADERVLLRPMAADDWDALYAVASDPLIWALHPAHDRWKEPVFRTYFEQGLASNGALVAIDRSTGRVIGSSRYDIRVALPGEVEIGWTFLVRSHWGGAWNASMKRLMLEHAFTIFDTAIFLVGETNLRSRRAMEKIGGRLTDRRQSWDMAGVQTGHVIYAITRDDFARGPLARSG
ncbi:MAG: GNAT family N-acetyltransferase [Sphingomonadaceae bacterium]|nr:GNAT family N-acetyltransferase [Sphingomonadaceae bacterium]